MVKNNSNKIRLMVEMSVLTALVVVFQLLSNVFQIGGVAITLSLLPLVIGAALHGVYAGVYLGFVLGLVNFISSFSNPVLYILFDSSPVLYILVCFGKTMLAGAASGGIYRLLRNKNSFLGACLSSIAAPLVNTGVFFLMMIAFFRDAIVEACGDMIKGSVVAFVITGFIGINFIVEFCLNAVLCPAIDRILRAVSPRSYAFRPAETAGDPVVGSDDSTVDTMAGANGESQDDTK